VPWSLTNPTEPIRTGQDLLGLGTPPYPKESTFMASVWNAAEVAIQTLRSIGLKDVCFVGGVACALYGNTRLPNVRALPVPRVYGLKFFWG
jgi:hypothetical protein